MENSGHQRERTVGVLGGLGPQASVDFLARLVAATPANNEQEHIHVLLDHNPRVPNRHASIAGEGPSAAPVLAEMAARLQQAGADFLVMACNTAHAYADEIKAAVSIPFVSIIDVTIEALSRQHENRIGVMAASGCLQAGLYQRALEQAGYIPILWSDSDLERFMSLVYRVKAGEDSPGMHSEMTELADLLQGLGAQALIAGCTEVPLLMRDGDSPLPLFSSTDLLVERTIALARHTLPLET